MDELENNKKFAISFSSCVQILPPMEQMEKINNFIVLYGGWGTPAAYDLESKCSEAASRAYTGGLLIARAFRHLWDRSSTYPILCLIAINPKDVVIIVLTFTNYLQSLISF